MLTRRGFAGCAVCAAVGLVATGVEAQTQPAPPSGIKRTVVVRAKRTLVRTTDLDDTYQTALVTLEVAPGTEVARHTHPGTESFYILEGELESSMEGQPDMRIKAGEGYQVPPYRPHGGRAGPD